MAWECYCQKIVGALLSDHKISIKINDILFDGEI